MQKKMFQRRFLLCYDHGTWQEEAKEQDKPSLVWWGWAVSSPPLCQECTGSDIPEVYFITKYFHACMEHRTAAAIARKNNTSRPPAGKLLVPCLSWHSKEC